MVFANKNETGREHSFARMCSYTYCQKLQAMHELL